MPVTSEAVCFPFAAQAARLDQKLGTHKPETVWLLTSRSAHDLSAEAWLKSRRDYWGIETGLHQRLDQSCGEDACRIRTKNSIWVLGMFHRLTVSIFMEWKTSGQKKRHRATMSDFFSWCEQEALQRGFALIHAKKPSLKGIL